MSAQSVEQRMERLEAVHAVQNVVGRYAFYMHGQKWDRIPELFAQNTPDVTCEVTSNGVYTGIEQIRKLWAGFLAAPRMLPDGPDPAARELYRKEKERVGRLTVHQMTTPVIESCSATRRATALFMDSW